MTRLTGYMIIMALVTYAIRAIPMLFFRKKIGSPFIQSFLYYVPYAVLGAMTFPAIFTSGNALIPSCIGCIAAIILAYREKSLLTVALAASFFVFVSSLFF